MSYIVSLGIVYKWFQQVYIYYPSHSAKMRRSQVAISHVPFNDSVQFGATRNKSGERKKGSMQMTFRIFNSLQMRLPCEGKLRRCGGGFTLSRDMNKQQIASMKSDQHFHVYNNNYKAFPNREHHHSNLPIRARPKTARNPAPAPPSDAPIQDLIQQKALFLQSNPERMSSNASFYRHRRTQSAVRSNASRQQRRESANLTPWQLQDLRGSQVIE